MNPYSRVERSERRRESSRSARRQHTRRFRELRQSTETAAARCQEHPLICLI